MMSQARLDALVAEQTAQGKNAAQIARNTGVPIQRVQATMHRLAGKDPAEANRITRKRRRQTDQRVWGTAYVNPDTLRRT